MGRFSASLRPTIRRPIVLHAVHIRDTILRAKISQAAWPVKRARTAYPALGGPGSGGRTRGPRGGVASGDGEVGEDGEGQQVSAACSFRGGTRGFYARRLREPAQSQTLDVRTSGFPLTCSTGEANLGPRAGGCRRSP